MQNIQTNKERMEQSNIQSPADTKDKESYPLLTREPLEDTPFWIVGSDEIGYKLTWGKYTFNDDPQPSIDKLTTWYYRHQWEITLHLIAIGITMEKIPKEQRTEKEPQ